MEEEEVKTRGDGEGQSLRSPMFPFLPTKEPGSRLTWFWFEGSKSTHTDCDYLVDGAKNLAIPK